VFNSAITYTSIHTFNSHFRSWYWCRRSSHPCNIALAVDHPSHDSIRVTRHGPISLCERNDARQQASNRGSVHLGERRVVPVDCGQRHGRQVLAPQGPREHRRGEPKPLQKMPASVRATRPFPSANGWMNTNRVCRSHARSRARRQASGATGAPPPPPPPPSSPRTNTGPARSSATASHSNMSRTSAGSSSGMGSKTRLWPIPTAH
jgi:hypothetical protein